MNRNSALIWFEAIKDQMPVPKTIMIKYSHVDFMSVVEGGEQETDLIKAKIIEIEKACEEIGYPCFIRSDLTSGKHEGPDCYLATDSKSLRRAIWGTVSDNEMKLWPWCSPDAFMVRQFLDLNYDFKAFNDLPIAREFRFFADGFEVKCLHPYWPESAIKFWKGNAPEGWQDQLKKHHETPKEIEELKRMAIEATKLLGGGEWSVDFAQDVNGKWWLIDMATAKESYHWEGCGTTFK